MPISSLSTADGPSRQAPVPGTTAATTDAAWRRGVRVFAQNRFAIVGVGVLVLIFGFCFIGPVFYHTDQVHTNLHAVTLPPSAAHLLGTDEFGYDELGRLMVGGQTSLEVGVAAAVIATFFGGLWGAVAGYVGGIVEGVLMRVVDVLLAIPVLFLMLLMASIFTPSKLVLIVIIAMVSWLIPARLVRGETLAIKVREYVEAARGMGAGGSYSLIRHILPNAIGTITVNVTFQVANAILTLAALSYLGLGTPPPSTDWGAMLSNGLNYSYAGNWWLIYPPGLAVVITVLVFNFIGDGLRDSVDARLQRA